MRRHVLAVAVLLAVHGACAAESTTLPTLDVRADRLSKVDSVVVVENTDAPNRTLGEMLEHVSGVQSSAFGPNAGAPVIRSLSGSRVQLLEDGHSILGMNAISGNINVPFDPLFVKQVTVNKSADSVRYGGNAIGGSVNVDTGLISRQMETKDQEMELLLRQGFNAADAQGFRMNFNNQRNVSTNLQMSVQRISHYDIPGNSKASVCDSQLFPAAGGVNSALADACQKEARVQRVYNKASQPFIDQFMTENPDWADGDFSFFTNQPTSVWMGKTYVNPANPQYVQGTPSYVQQQINRDVTPNYTGTLGNSYFRNTHLAAGSTYFFDRGYVAASIDSKDSEYGVPGFSMENLSFGSDYSQGRPVGVKLQQDTYTVLANVREPLPLLDSAEVNLSKLSSTAGEYLGASKANQYAFDTYQGELVLNHRRAGALTGQLGTGYQSRSITGSGPQRYLPDVETQAKALFVKETLTLPWATFDAGYRHEKIDHEIQASRFQSGRNSPNGSLKDRDFNLESYSAGGYFKLGKWFAATLRYADSQRAPDVNELYASNAHYSTMTQEEGSQALKPERAKTQEFTLAFSNAGFEATATAYEMKYENYLYLGYSGLQTANRLPLKYWKQTDTTVKGFEVDVSQALELGPYGSLQLSAFSDLVKNKADHPDSLRAHNDGQYLPNMPTNRYGANVAWQRGGWKAHVSGTYYDTQQYLGRYVSEEIPLPAFTLVDMQVSYAFPIRNAYVSALEVFVNGSNLLDEEARPHNSPLKYIAPLPGRGFQIGLNVKL
ncbi:TonB-dependent receptor [Stenotrophomonas sp. S48]|uniref:TonB-dependent receptor domain-containing protein n=1 Tax=unclassified Stenotrophomonas TaxID=196198 RepID=UPI0019023CA1|nr:MULTISPECIES: TonB-dependent receptor [unclassified Stenotrophomonas]MBK0024936.1 TonB-dependent receptor [Stenotrophomonas sp. S48]MBK0047176.1 TonB-dependent receptor [Stenotrophomonas sp. S49]